MFYKYKYLKFNREKKGKNPLYSIMRSHETYINDVCNNEYATATEEIYSVIGLG